MPMPDHAFIHPLLGTTGAWSGYLVEFAPGAPHHDILVNLDNSPLLDAFDHRALWFFPAEINGREVSRLGARAIPFFSDSPAAEDIDALKQLEAGFRKAARKVSLLASPDHNDREWALNNACGLSTSEFLQIRSPAQTKADITRLKLLKLLALIVEDADTAALDAIFREEQKLSYSLLRLVNSAALSPRTPIASFSQAINLLGRRQLQRWLQLLVYSDPNNGQLPNPLLQKAAARGRLLELLAPHLDGTADGEVASGDLAFMIGTFSLLGVLLSIPMPEILKQLPLPEIVHKALADHGGELGKLLAAIATAERRELSAASQRFNALGIDAVVYLDAQLEAFNWAAKIHAQTD